MEPLDAVNHLINLLLPALGLAASAAGLAKLLWRKELKPVSWRRLALPAGLACAGVAVVGLVVSGHDGRMATYAAMVVVCAVMLWWQGFGPGRR